MLAQLKSMLKVLADKANVTDRVSLANCMTTIEMTKRPNGSTLINATETAKKQTDAHAKSALKTLMSKDSKEEQRNGELAEGTYVRVIGASKPLNGVRGRVLNSRNPYEVMLSTGHQRTFRRESLEVVAVLERAKTARMRFREQRSTASAGATAGKQTGPTPLELCEMLLAPVVGNADVAAATSEVEQTMFVSWACSWFLRNSFAPKGLAMAGANAGETGIHAALSLPLKNETTDNVDDLQAKYACFQMETLSAAMINLAKERIRMRNYDCTTDDPDNVCSGLGICKCKMCYCRNGFMGIDCSIPTCPYECGRHGHCCEGECCCAEGWLGELCNIKDCSLDDNLERCSGHGLCSIDHISGPLAVENGFKEAELASQGDEKGAEEEAKNTPKAECMCVSGWDGPTCADRTCVYGRTSVGTTEACSGHGTCNDARCECDSGFIGEACETCQNKEHMTCVDNSGAVLVSGAEFLSNACTCHDGYFGTCCNRVGCASGCSGNGHCDASLGVCVCDKGFFGTDCSGVKPACGAKDCSGRGVCVPIDGGGADRGTVAAGVSPPGKCLCEPSWRGEHCDEVDCPMGCLAPNRGVCQANGLCKCHAGYEGKSCERKYPVEPECSASCGDRCLHFGGCQPDEVPEELTYTHAKSLHRSIRGLKQTKTEEVLLEIGSGSKKSLGCYWQCLRHCVMEQCLKGNFPTPLPLKVEPEAAAAGDGEEEGEEGEDEEKAEGEDEEANIEGGIDTWREWVTASTRQSPEADTAAETSATALHSLAAQKERELRSKALLTGEMADMAAKVAKETGDPAALQVAVRAGAAAAELKVAADAKGKESIVPSAEMQKKVLAPKLQMAATLTVAAQTAVEEASISSAEAQKKFKEAEADLAREQDPAAADKVINAAKEVRDKLQVKRAAEGVAAAKMDAMKKVSAEARVVDQVAKLEAKAEDELAERRNEAP